MHTQKGMQKVMPDFKLNKEPVQHHFINIQVKKMYKTLYQKMYKKIHLLL
ncbi:MAG: hypothetical protein QXG00_01655 [Candidatus Woesearchaeota archaeon]